MARRGILALIVLILTSGVTAFYIGRAGVADPAAAAGQTDASWLPGASDATIQAEHQFEQQARQLAEAVRTEQAALSALLADANATDEQVLAQVDRITESYGVLVRSVGRHLMRLREGMPRSQALSLMRSCAGSVRGQVQRRYRWRGGVQDGARGMGYMGGRGGAGRGRGGPGFGRQYRGGQTAGRGLAGRLGLNDEQVAWIQQQDPEFESESMLLRNRLNQVHMNLAESLENPQIDSEVLLASIDELVHAHGDLEIRVAQHLLLLRPCLSPEQRERLSSLCGSGSRSWGNGSSRMDPVDMRGVQAGYLAEALFERAR